MSSFCMPVDNVSICLALGVGIWPRQLYSISARMSFSVRRQENAPPSSRRPSKHLRAVVRRSRALHETVFLSTLGSIAPRAHHGPSYSGSTQGWGSCCGSSILPGPNEAEHQKMRGRSEGRGESNAEGVGEPAAAVEEGNERAERVSVGKPWVSKE